MKKFFQSITHDSYTDWLVIVCISLVAIILSALWSFSIYQTATITHSAVSTESTTKASIDMERLEKTVEIFNKKAEIFNSPTLPVIDVRDPSL